MCKQIKISNGLRLTQSDDMGIFLHFSTSDGRASGINLSPDSEINHPYVWAVEQLTTRMGFNDKDMLEIALKKLSLAFDSFVADCIDKAGRPKAPDCKSLMRARGCLLPYCSCALARGNHDKKI